MAARELGAQHLDRDLAVVPEVVREIDGRHAAGAELALDDDTDRRETRSTAQQGSWADGRWSCKMLT